MSKIFSTNVFLVRKEKGLSREALADLVGTSAPIIGRYERNEMVPSVENAAKIAQALEVSLDYLIGKSSVMEKNKAMLERFEDIHCLPENKQNELFNVIDAYIRDFKTAKSYKGE
jgi:transcriptional regulator with XRE-family HTH domain